MNKKLPAGRWIWRATVGISLLLIFVLVVGTMLSPDFWFNADQRGDWLFRQGKFEQAAKIFSDPLHQGVALYRAGDFLPASKSFVRVRDAAGAFDRLALRLSGSLQGVGDLDDQDAVLADQPHQRD